MKILPLILLSLFFGCSATTFWHKPGMTHLEFDKDTYECEKEARFIGDSARSVPVAQGYDQIATGLNALSRNIGAANQEDRFYKKCMRGRGYALVVETGATCDRGDDTIICVRGRSYVAADTPRSPKP